MATLRERGPGLRPQGNPQRKQNICRFFRDHGRCKFSTACKYSHDLSGTNITQTKATTAPPESASVANYRRWRLILRNCFEPQDRERLWEGALAILEGNDREVGQNIAQDLSSINDPNESGLRQIRNLVEERAQSGQIATFIRTRRSFLMVMTHSAFLDCLSLDIHVGTLYGIISGSDGERAVPFFQHICEVLETTATDGSLSVLGENVESTLLAMSIALCALLARHPRARFHDELSALVSSLDNVTTVATRGAPSIVRQHVTRRIEDMRASIARARGYLSENTNVRPDEQYTPLSSYPRGIQMPRGRHDNDKTDIAEMSIYPTADEILSDEIEFLPSIDPDQPHYLTEKVERHIDTCFRLLRHDTFGELKSALANLMNSIEENPASLQNFELGLENMRAYPYTDACIDRLAFQRYDGLQAQISFPQPSPVQKKSAAEIRAWWKESKRLTDGVLLSFIWFDGMSVQHLFLTTARVTDQTAQPIPQDDQRKTVSAKLTAHGPKTVQSLLDLESREIKGILLEYPNILPGTFVPVLENLQNMQRLGRLPFRDWILPERADQDHLNITVPLYARDQGFYFSLESIQHSTDATIRLYPTSSSDDDVVINNMLAKTELDHGQCRALVAALKREFAFIQGPPGTGKSYLGINLVKVLLDTKNKANLGPIVVVCYTNHALDQFLEQLHDSGVRKIVRIGGQSRSEKLEGHNLRNLGKTETKTRSESKQVRDAYAALTGHESTINSKLSQAHGMQKRIEWGDLDEYLASIYPAIHAQFQQNDDDGFTIVGRHPFDIWRSNNHVLRGHSAATDPTILTQKATVNVNHLSPSERFLLVEYWVYGLQRDLNAELFECIVEAESSQKIFTNVRKELNRRVLQDTDVIGLTTTGLAKNILTLQRVQCKVVICEEAGEVMETHMISAMLPTVEHCIQIGDHEQLRPTINNFKDLSLETAKGRQYQLDRSQFERLSKGQNGRPSVPIVQLNTQRRMRPEISSLIRETIYPGLLDHPSISSLPDVVGMRSNVFWFDHDNPETRKQTDIYQKSKSNAWEVTMVHALVRHLIRQGTYSSSDIAVLTPYTGQLQKLRAVMRNDFEIVLSDRDEDALAKDGFTTVVVTDEDDEASFTVSQDQDQRRKPLQKKKLSELLRLATVDNFQGEEAKIVIVSLVRSNDRRNVGFLRTTNRINVLLSRAQYGMFIIGNTDTYSNIPMWDTVIGMLRAKNAVDTNLSLCCPRHPDTIMYVKQPEDFALFSPEGGCREPCQDRLPECGHRCQSRCHSKAMHDVWKCERPCERRHDYCKHPCMKSTCGEDCGRCMVILHGVELSCGHLKNNVACYLTQEMDRIVCNAVVEKEVPWCGHTVPVPCELNVAAKHYRCPTRCGEHLPCGHDCTDTCGDCNTKDSEGQPVIRHSDCRKVCGRPFGACSHTCPRTCHSGQDCGLCKSKCEVRCKHSQCTLQCHEACAPCVEPCTWSCVHQGACTMPCAAPCNRLPCDKRCTEQLPCGHQCPGLCGENCPEKYCQDCGMMNDAQVDMLDFKTYGEIDLNDTPVIFLNCGHFFTAETLDIRAVEISGLKDMSTQLAKGVPHCPRCRTPIRQYATQRYNRLINRAVIDEMSKRFIVTGQTELRGLEEKLRMLEKQMEGNRAAATTACFTSISAYDEDRLAAELTKQLEARYKAPAKLQANILRFQKRVDKRHQPSHKLHEATVYAMQQDRNAKLNSAFAALSLRDTVPSSERDHRIISGGQMTLLKAECLSLEDKFHILRTIESDYKKIATSVRFPGRSPRQLVRPFLQKCARFVIDCDGKKLPKLAVEGTLCFARIARLYITSGLIEDKDREKAASYSDEAKVMLENAKGLCTKKFRDAEMLLQAVEESMKLLQREWDEEVTAEELATIKAAMLSGSGAFATHSGQWYNCVNGHPFAIGEYGMLMQQATCPECGARIGGQDHEAVAGVTRVEDMEL